MGGKYNDRERAMIVIMQDVVKHIKKYERDKDLSSDNYLARFPRALMEQYLEKIDLEEVED